MARGWESKSVESQMEEAQSRRAPTSVAVKTAEELARERERESLELSRTRVMLDLQAASNPRYRESLQAALKHLETKLAALS